MAGFCRNCGSPLDDVQAFCAKCGTSTAGPPTRPAAPASAAPRNTPPAPRPQAAAPPSAPAAPASAASKGGGGTFVKILVGLVVVVVFFCAIGIAGVWYVGHRIKQKAHEIGLDEMSSENARANRAPALGGRDACSLLAKEDVTLAVKMEVVRAEATEGKGAGCTYSVQGETTDLVAKHATLLQKGDMTEQQRQSMESFAKTIFKNANAEQSGTTTNSAHPGESPVLVFNVDNQGAKALMSMTRATLGRMGPSLTELPGLGDDAFDLAGAIIMVRKGDKILNVMYMMCPCAREDVVPLVKKIADAL